MRIWPALLLAPILALADQAVAYGVSGWACSHQQPLAMHVVHLALLLVVVASTALAAQLWRATRPAASSTHERDVRHFLAGLATASGAFSAVVIVAMWYPSWVISPCFN